MILVQLADVEHIVTQRYADRPAAYVRFRTYDEILAIPARLLRWAGSAEVLTSIHCRCGNGSGDHKSIPAVRPKITSKKRAFMCDTALNGRCRLVNLPSGFSLNQEAAPDPVEPTEFRHSLSSKRNPLARYGGLFFIQGRLRYRRLPARMMQIMPLVTRLKLCVMPHRKPNHHCLPFWE
jgi:hypothetical protein